MDQRDEGRSADHLLDDSCPWLLCCGEQVCPLHGCADEWLTDALGAEGGSKYCEIDRTPA